MSISEAAREYFGSNLALPVVLDVGDRSTFVVFFTGGGFLMALGKTKLSTTDEHYKYIGRGRIYFEGEEVGIFSGIIRSLCGEVRGLDV